MDDSTAPNLLRQPELSRGIPDDIRARREGICMVALAQRPHMRLGCLQRDPLHCHDICIGQEGIFGQETSTLVQE